MRTLALLAVLMFVGCAPDPVPLLEVTFYKTNSLGVEIPVIGMGRKEVGKYKTFSRPMRTGVLGGTRWTLITTDGKLVELKGSYDFEIKHLETIPHTDSRHPEYEE